MSKRDELAAVLGAHEARWTTYGNVRLYYVMHCVSPDCDWSLRQKTHMSEAVCYAAHRRHQVDAVLAWLGGQFDEGLREAVGKTLHASGGCDCGGWFYKDADAAIAVVRARLGLSDAAQDAQDGSGTASEVEGGSECRSDAARPGESRRESENGR